MKPNNGHGAVRALGGRIAAVLLGVVCALCVSATPALAAESSITNARTGKTYDKLADATADAQSGDTIKLGEGNYTLYGVSSVGNTKGKDLTFEGLGTDKTAWNIGAKVPNPDNFGTVYNGDYSFDGAGTVTFKNMTMRSGSADYLGFIRANKTVVDGCVINGKTFYWGYQGAEFRNTTFNAPNGDYAIWTYSSPTMTFDTCTFNASGKVINVYTDYSAGQHDITVNVNNCTFNSATSLLAHKQALNINDFNMRDYKYILNITGTNTVNFTGWYKDKARDNTTCSKLFGFGGKASTNNKGKTDVNINGELVWSVGEMKTHSYTDGEHDGNFKDQNNYVWNEKSGNWYCTGHATCGYCGRPIEETVKATFVDKTDCTEKGERTYTATFTHKCFKPQTKIEALDPIGHDWDEPEYSWAKKDDGWYCTAKSTCKRDASHVEEQTVKAAVETTPATCTEAGKDVYTATFDGDVFESQTRDDVIPALDHDWGEPEYSWAKQDDGWYCTAERTCKRDASHVEMETVKATYEVTTPATTKKEGVGTYTAIFENEAFETQTKTEAIAKLPAEPSKPSENTQKPAQKKAKSAVPATGDSINTALPVAAAIAGVALVGVVAIRKRDER